MSTEASGKRGVGVLLCTCNGVTSDEHTADQIVSRLKFTEGTDLPVLVTGKLCGEAGTTEASRFVAKHDLGRLVVAGCPTRSHDRTAEELSRSIGIHPRHIRGVDFARCVTREQERADLSSPTVDRVVATVVRNLAALRLTEDVETVDIEVDRSVAVLGDGDLAALAAAEVERFGLRAERLAVDGRIHVEGSAGHFVIRDARESAAPTSPTDLRCGAIIDVRDPDPFTGRVYETSSVVRLSELGSVFASLPHIPKERSVAIVLDYEIDETKASTKEACEIALRIHRQGVCQVYVFCRSVRVASLELESVYDQAREAGVVFVSYDGKVAFEPGERGTAVLATDAVVGQVRIPCDLVAVSELGFHGAESSERYVNNLRFAPVETAIPGFYVAGPASGQYYRPQAVEEVLSAAFEAGRLLGSGSLELELLGPQVDEDKCAACLTCVRACPHQAMTIDNEKSIAKNIPEACRHCGICVGVCPARALSLPGDTEEIALCLLQ